MYKFTEQRAKDGAWRDETGASIPVNRITKAEKLREKKAFQLANKATAIHEEMKAFKQKVRADVAEVIEAIRQDAKIKTDTKGNYTWYNFDHSIKIEVAVQDRIEFDETLIDAAKEKLIKLIDVNITGDDFIKGLVLDAFKTSSGKLDTRRVLGLKKYSSRIKDMFIKKQWDEAMELIDKSISRPDSRTYFRVWIKDELGEYQNIDLNFSSIKV